MSEPEFIMDCDYVRLEFDDKGEVTAMHVPNLSSTAENPTTPLFLSKKPSVRGAMYHVLYNKNIYIVQKDSFGRWRAVFFDFDSMREYCSDSTIPLPRDLTGYLFISIADTMYIGSLNNKYEITRVKL